VTDLAILAIANARRWATGVSLETLGPNDGPEIRQWLLRRGLHQPAPWCAAFACAMVQDAAHALGIVPELHYSAGALRLLALNDSLAIQQPEPGCLVVWDHGGGKGHVGIVTTVAAVAGEVAAIRAIAGNTNLEGSREGNAVVERGFDAPVERLAGYIRIG
jgi:hypothetical protein